MVKQDITGYVYTNSAYHLPVDILGGRETTYLYVHTYIA